MQALSLTPATIVLLIAIIALAALAIHRLVSRGMCDCHDGESGGCAGCGHSKGKKECGAEGTCPSCNSMSNRLAAYQAANKK